MKRNGLLIKPDAKMNEREGKLMGPDAIMTDWDGLLMDVRCTGGVSYKKRDRMAGDVLTLDSNDKDN